jgi:hypothetical protein
MSLVRSWVCDPSFPFILIADVYRTGLTADQSAQLDQYVGALLAIAQSDPNVMVINSRRLMDDLGWNANSGLSGNFLIDCCHYTPYAAQTLAAAEVAAMMGQVLVSSCSNDASAVLQATETLTIDLGGATACSGFTILSFGAIVGQFAAVELPVTRRGAHVGYLATPDFGCHHRSLRWRDFRRRIRRHRRPPAHMGNAADGSASPGYRSKKAARPSLSGPVAAWHTHWSHCVAGLAAPWTRHCNTTPGNSSSWLEDEDGGQGPLRR